MSGFWNQNNYRKLLNISVFLIILGGVLSVIELLTENSSSIFISGIIILVILKMVLPTQVLSEEGTGGLKLLKFKSFITKLIL